MPTTAQAQAPSQFPRVLVTNLTTLNKQNGIRNFNYPLIEEPNIMVKLGQNAVGGVGPDGDIVAFSLLCTHAGCHVYVNRTFGICQCHAARFDLANGGKAIKGPAIDPQPQVTLEFDSATGDIFATGMGPPRSMDMMPDPTTFQQTFKEEPLFPSFSFPFLASFVTAVCLVFGSLVDRAKRGARESQNESRMEQ
jgi:arsenite oxidase small subunit